VKKQGGAKNEILSEESHNASEQGSLDLPDARIAKASPAQRSAEEGIASPSVDPAILQQLQELREQVRLLQEALDWRPVVPPAEGPNPSRAATKHDEQQRETDTKHGPVPASKKGTKYTVDVGEKNRLLFTARDQIKVNTSRLVFDIRDLTNMSSPGVSPLARRFIETLPVFKEHLREAYVICTGFRTPRPPRLITTESRFLKAEALLEQAIASLSGRKAAVQLASPASTVAANMAVTERRDQPRPVQTFDHTRPEPTRLVRNLSTKASGGPLSEPITQRPAIKKSPSRRSTASLERSNEQSLLEELFPEASSYTQPHYTPRNPYPKLDLPNDMPLIRPSYTNGGKTKRERIVESFQARSEPLTALQLVHCSTALTEADFRRLVPKGKHIETWVRDGEFHKVIPGRDPLTLERLPFYYLLFKSPESALAYQNNAVRLHKLSGLHQPSSIFSAIPPPRGFLEDGEDLDKVMSSYLLKPTSLQLNLNMLMQPYNPNLRALIERGGYVPIVPSVSSKGQPLWKVLLQIDGWEPLREDLYYGFTRHAYERGLSWPFHGGAAAIHKLRDIIDVKTKLQSVSSANPRAASNSDAHAVDMLKLDPLEQSGGAKGELNQIVMNRLYNRWVVDFEDEGAARRFARLWHRRVLPNERGSTWKDVEEPRMISAEFLW
jgi:hypothetical protein